MLLIMEHSMTATNPTIDITIPREISEILDKTARRANKSVSEIALELIEWAIEEREDIYFSKIADAIEQSDPQWVKDSDAVWG